MSKLNPQAGYTFVELLVAMLLSMVLVLGITLAYSSITGLVSVSKNLENAQEVLRYSSEVFSRSLKQTATLPTIVDQHTLSVEQDAHSIACDGSRPTDNFTERFSISANYLKCDIGSGEKTILTGIENITFERNEKLVSVYVQPLALHGEPIGKGPSQVLKIDIALSEIILKNATGS